MACTCIMIVCLYYTRHDILYCFYLFLIFWLLTTSKKATGDMPEYILYVEAIMAPGTNMFEQ